MNLFRLIICDYEIGMNIYFQCGPFTKWLKPRLPLTQSRAVWKDVAKIPSEWPLEKCFISLIKGPLKSYIFNSVIKQHPLT